MSTPILTIEECTNIESGPWFSKLSPLLRSDILSHSIARRMDDGALLSSRGSPAEQWVGVARGAVRVSTVSISGQQITLTYVAPGTWFGDIALLDGLPRTHDAHAHGATTLLVVRKADFKALLTAHVELYDALLHLNSRRLRLLFETVEDIYTKPLASRLAKLLLLLTRRYGIKYDAETLIGLQLSQEELAQMVGASRQRVNQELKSFERKGALRIEPARVVVLDREHLMAIASE